MHRGLTMSTKNSESNILSIQELQGDSGIMKVNITINLRKEVYEYLDKCFQLINLTWDSFFQKEINNTIESLKDQASCWLGEMIQEKLREI